jgi:hypothetical protein
VAKAGSGACCSEAVLECAGPLFTFDDDQDKNLLQLGARPFDMDAIKLHLTEAPTCRNQLPGHGNTMKRQQPPHGVQAEILTVLGLLNSVELELT